MKTKEEVKLNIEEEATSLVKQYSESKIKASRAEIDKART
jgi:hypothetical protein